MEFVPSFIANNQYAGEIRLKFITFPRIFMHPGMKLLYTPIINFIKKSIGHNIVQEVQFNLRVYEKQNNWPTTYTKTPFKECLLTYYNTCKKIRAENHAYL